MIHENGECRNPNLTSYKEKTLLSKYDIPIDHLSYEYIQQCSVVKELERILRVLRSGEEGFYPDLIKKAEDKLRLISPNNRALTVEEPVLTKYTMAQDDWNGTIHDLKVWTDEMKVKDNELAEANNNSETDNLIYPPVRKDSAKQKSLTTNPEAKVKNKKSPIPSTDWSKYDADTEVLKMDLEEEKKIQERKKIEKEKNKDDDSQRLNDLIAQSELLSEVEKKYLAEQEKNRGNEYFNAKDYNEAIKYYTSSIAVLPTAVAHNNRAMCYLKMCKYTAALEDTNIAIEMDPNNVKAYFRRGLALQHKNQFQQALADMDQVLEREPNHAIARHIANDLREQCLSMPKKIRLLIEDKDPSGARRKKIVVVTEEEYKASPKLQQAIEVNEWGLPKTMCTCNGTPPFLRLTTYPPKIAEHVLVRDPKKKEVVPSNESADNCSGCKIVELDNREENNGNYYSGDEKTDRPKRIEIMEVDNIDDECAGDRKNKSSRPKFNVVDMRGKETSDKVNLVNNNDFCKSGAIPKTKLVNGDIKGKEGVEKVNLQNNNDICNSGAIPKTKMVNGDRYVHSKVVKTNSNIASKEQNSSAELDKCYRKPSIIVANKYKSVRELSGCNDVPELEEMNEVGNVSSISSVKMSPFVFNSIWQPRQYDNVDKQAETLRSVQPSDVPKLVGNKLDENMLSSILRCLKVKFDARVEKELVKDYLIALTNCERFRVIVSFLTSKDCLVIKELVEDLNLGDSASQLLKDFCL